jgi:hypothetical protein
VLNVFLMFVLVRRIFRSDVAGVIGGALLALTPAHFIHSRLATSQIGTLPFVIGWLIGIARYLDSGNRKDLALASFCLALGTYAYLSAAVMLPLFVIGTLAVIVVKRREERAMGDVMPRLRSDFVATFAALGLAVAPLLLWNVSHLDRFSNLVTYYTNNGYNNDIRLADSWLRVLVRRLDLWWNCLNPEQVFFSGDSSPRYSTRQVGYLLLPTIIFMVSGIRGLRRLSSRPLAALITVAILIAPIPAIFGGDYEIKRWLSVLPFVVLLMLAGIHLAVASRRVVGAAAVALVLLADGVQFERFYAHYNGPYRSQYAFYFGGNLRGAILDVLAQPPADDRCVFLDGRSDVVPYWRLYTGALGRSELARRATVLTPEKFNMTVPAECRTAAYLVLENSLPPLQEANWTRTAMPEADGKVMIAVYRYAVD